MRQSLVSALLIAASIVCSASPLAAMAADPSLHDIYQAAESGHLDQAQTMIGTVLADHPNSAKAHYVAAELDARQGRIAGAREQLATAQRLAPGLPFAKPESVAALQAQLGSRAVLPPTSVAAGGPHIPWTPIVLGVLLLSLLLIWRNTRRSSPPAYPAPQAMGGGAMPPYPNAPASGGLGSTLATGLAGGLAAGAGIVAGEALMNRLLDGGARERVGTPLDDASRLDDTRGNADMGGDDFGVSDAGSWDDDSAQSGGDDWG